MERRSIVNRWASERWLPVAVVERDEGAAGDAEPILIDQGQDFQRWLHVGFRAELFRDEAEGYYLNLSTDQPYVFVEWEMRSEMAVPRWITLSYHEAARRMDGGAQVDGVPVPFEWLPWVAEFTQQHLQIPEKRRQRIKAASFNGARRDD